jgi:hypothetical protein
MFSKRVTGGMEKKSIAYQVGNLVFRFKFNAGIELSYLPFLRRGIVTKTTAP